MTGEDFTYPLIRRPRVTPLRIISTDGGEVRHGLRNDDPDFAGFGEAYFSRVQPGQVRGWKQHSAMALNLIVVFGTMRFVVLSNDGADRLVYNLSADRSQDYGRLTVPPGWWMAFGAVGGQDAMLLNVASIPHDPSEVRVRPLDLNEWPGD